MGRPSELLAPLTTLIGEWETDSDMPGGRVHCTRQFAPTLGGAFIELVAHWAFASGAGYEEHAFFGAARDGSIGTWSFTSDGGHSIGSAADVREIHPEGIGFIAMMPAGRARQAYWIAEGGSLNWVVEAETPTGWERFTSHRYTRRG